MQNIVFDMGRVLMDYDSDRVCAHYMQEKALRDKVRRAVFDSAEWVYLDMGVMEEAEALSRMQARLDTEEERELAALCFRDWHFYNKWPFPGMEALVQELYAAGCRLYILSNASLRVPEKCLGRIPGASLMSGMLFSAQVGYLKPQPEIFHQFFNRFSLDPASCFFIDDLPMNIAGAKRVGMDGYCFADGDVEKLREALSKRLGVSLSQLHEP